MHNYGVYQKNDVFTNAICKEKDFEGWGIYKLPDLLSSEDMFIKSMQSTFPLDPPLSVGSKNWDALNDSLWNALHGLKLPGIIIIWPNSMLLKKLDPKAYRLAIEVFDSISKTIRDPKYGGGWTTNLLVLLSAEEA